MKIAFTSFPLKKNLEAKKELENKYGIHTPEDADIIVALGGDGFVLKSLHEYLKLSKPIFGMNFGSVGFLMKTTIQALGITDKENLRVFVSSRL